MREPEPDKLDPAYEIVAPTSLRTRATGVLVSCTEDGFVDRFEKGGAVFKGTVMPCESFVRVSEVPVPVHAPTRRAGDGTHPAAEGGVQRRMAIMCSARCASSVPIEARRSR